MIHGSGKEGYLCLVAAVLLAVLAGVTVFCLITKEDKVTILYNLLYYVIFTAFTEEFVVRDVCTWILRTEKLSADYRVGFKTYRKSG